jgi:hypothetical protein
VVGLGRFQQGDDARQRGDAKMATRLQIGNVLPLFQQHRQPVHVIPHNPTAENIARLIFEYAQQQGFPVVEVTMWETPPGTIKCRLLTSGGAPSISV